MPVFTVKMGFFCFGRSDLYEDHPNTQSWLGVSVPPEIEHSILAAANAMGQSIAICRSILEEILSEMED